MSAPRTILSISILIIAVIAAPRANGPDDSHRPTFRTNVELVVLHVNVADRQHRPITSLTKDDFIVLENGRPQQLSHFISPAGPLDVALLVDGSGSMMPLLPTLRKAAFEFLGGLSADDRGMVVGFSRRIRMLTDLTIDRQPLREALDQIRANGSTSLYDGLYVTIKSLAARSRHLSRRQALVVLSDGQDTSSLIEPDEVYRESIRQRVPIYTILFGEEDFEAKRQTLPYAQYSRLARVRTLARDTGGRTFQIEDVLGLEDAYEAIAVDLAQQYVLAYVSSGPTRATTPRVTVRIPSLPAAIARTHIGYLPGISKARISKGG